MSSARAEADYVDPLPASQKTRDETEWWKRAQRAQRFSRVDTLRGGRETFL